MEIGNLDQSERILVLEKTQEKMVFICKMIIVVLQLVVDDGVPNRGHRTNFFDPDYKLVGIFACEHKSYKHVVVLDYSVNWKDGAVVKDD